MSTGAISADSHVVEPREVFAGLEERFGDEAPRITAYAGAADAMVIPAAPKIRPHSTCWEGVAGLRLRPGARIERRETHKPAVVDLDSPDVQATLAQGYAGLRRGIRESRHRQEDQALDGVRAEVLFPSLFFAVFGLPNVELVVAAFRNYNDWIRDYQSQAPDRLRGLALLPLHDPDAGLAELDRALAAGLRGGCIPCRAPSGRSYRDPAYQRIWAAAAEAAFPLHMHVATDAYVPREQRPRARRDPIAEYAGAVSIVQESLVDFLCGGVAHRFPSLRIVVSEFNTGWIAHWLDRLDQGFARNRRAASPDLDRLPSEYWSRQFYATFEDDRAGVLTRERVGVHTLMWANDYPHLDSTWPCSRDVQAEIFAGVPEAEVRAMTVENAARLYDLPAA